MIERGKRGIRPRSWYTHDNLCQLAKSVYCCPTTAAGAGHHLTAGLITTEAPLHVPIVLPATTICRAAIGSRK